MRVLLQKLRERDVLVLALVFVIGTAAYFGVADEQGQRGGVAHLDGYYYYVYLRSVQVDGDLDFSNEYEQWGNPFGFGKTDTGRARNVFGVGPALLWAPFFVATHSLVLVGRGVFGAMSLSVDGMSRFHQVGTFFGSLVYGWLAVVLCYLVARRLVGRRHALWATLGAALAGPLPYYCLGGAAYSHAHAAMATSLLTWLWIRWRDALDRRRWILLGAATGLVLLARPAALPFVLLPLAEGIRTLWPALRQRNLAALGRAAIGPALGALAALAVFSPQLAVWQLLNGSLLTVPQGEGFLWWSHSAWHATLFSPRNGLLTSAPLMAVALVGLVGLARERRSPARLLLLVFAGYVLLNGAVHDWWGWNFSARRFTSCLPLFVIGLGAALRWTRERLQQRPARSAARLTAAAIAVVAIFNLEWMRSFMQQNLKWYDTRSTQGLYMTVTHNLVDRLYDTLGNPLSSPASVPFAIRHQVSPRVYDRIHGSYLLGEVHPDANPGGQPYLHALMDLSSPRFRYNLSDSFGSPVRETEVFYVPLREQQGHVLLPINRPGELSLLIRGQALHPDTRVDLAFNGRHLASQPLPAGRWTALHLRVPGGLVERGVNRLDLAHHVPARALAPGPRLVGRTGQRSPVDIAVASGGLQGGRFCEIWVDGRLVSSNHKGLNVAVIAAGSGEVLGTRGLAVHLHGSGSGPYRELGRYLDAFPRGSLVAVGVRSEVGRGFGSQARQAFARLGAITDLDAFRESGYGAIGVLGAAAGTALEQTASTGHARVRVGRPPPPWREIARYSAIRLR